jgi:D-3-phosphoglycerate dehydrogenase
MEKNFYFVNTARGKNLKTKSLVEAIRSGKVSGACLDVLEYEKSSFENLETENQDLQFLLDSDRVIVTPHIGGWTHQSKIKLAQFIVDKIIDSYTL